VSENRVLRKIFGPKQGGVTDGWKICALHQMLLGNRIKKSIGSSVRIAR
jgi:hypothetical protein